MLKCLGLYVHDYSCGPIRMIHDVTQYMGQMMLEYYF
jgi:hypothetical protein